MPNHTTSQDNPQDEPQPVTIQQKESIYLRITGDASHALYEALFTGSVIHHLNDEVARLSGYGDFVIPREEAMRIIERVMEFYNRVTDEEIEILNARIVTTKPDKSVKARRKRAGYVYLLKSASGYYKIGYTDNPTNRMAVFKTKLPFEVEFEALIQTEDMNELEDELHTLYKDKHVNGEWFALTPEDVEYIKSLQDGEA